MLATASNLSRKRPALPRLRSQKTALQAVFCTSGGGEIRTLDGVSPMPPFQGGALDRYATPPLSLYSCECVDSYSIISSNEKRRHAPFEKRKWSLSGYESVSCLPWLIARDLNPLILAFEPTPTALRLLPGQVLRAFTRRTIPRPVADGRTSLHENTPWLWS